MSQEHFDVLIFEGLFSCMDKGPHVMAKCLGDNPWVRDFTI